MAGHEATVIALRPLPLPVLIVLDPLSGCGPWSAASERCVATLQLDDLSLGQDGQSATESIEFAALILGAERIALCSAGPSFPTARELLSLTVRRQRLAAAARVAERRCARSLPVDVLWFDSERGEPWVWSDFPAHPTVLSQHEGDPLLQQLAGHSRLRRSPNIRISR